MRSESRTTVSDSEERPACITMIADLRCEREKSPHVGLVQAPEDENKEGKLTQA